MKYLSAPWRWDFICGLKKENGCVFCQVQSKNGSDSLICWRGDKFFVILNKYPYSTGHLIIAPYAHCASPEELPAGELAEMWELTNRSLTILKENFHPEGFNIFTSISSPAGKGMPVSWPRSAEPG
jgi:ATP adenylyltransferase